MVLMKKGKQSAWVHDGDVAYFLSVGWVVHEKPPALTERNAAPAQVAEPNETTASDLTTEPVAPETDVEAKAEPSVKAGSGRTGKGRGDAEKKKTGK